MSKVAQCDKNGLHVGYDDDFGGPMPINCFTDLPEERTGFVAKRKANGKGWEYIEDHRGEKGFVAGIPMTIAEAGPLPKGWSQDYVDPRPANEIRKCEILACLDKIDKLSIRALRSTCQGAGSAEDEARLNELEGEAKALRTELAQLTE